MLPFLGFYFGKFNLHGNIEFFADNSNFLVVSLCTNVYSQLLFAKETVLTLARLKGKHKVMETMVG